MNRLKATCLLTFIMLLLTQLSFTLPANAATVAEKRQAVRNTSTETLSKLYEMRPNARQAIADAAGYAVFTSTGIKLFVLGGGAGKGLAVNNHTGEEVFMRMTEIQAGLGLGIKRYNLVFVFAYDQAFDKFTAGKWDFGGQATAAATDSVSGGSLEGAISVSPGVWLYQMTDKGLALELGIKGTEFYRDSDLN